MNPREWGAAQYAITAMQCDARFVVTFGVTYDLYIACEGMADEALNYEDVHDYYWSTPGEMAPKS